MPRAFLVDGTGANIQQDNNPASTVVATAHSKSAMPRAYLVDGVNAGNFGKPPTVRDGEAPSLTVYGNQARGFPKAWLSQGRVVKMTPRALARFQTFPDTYELPDKNGLACKGIGNACPPEEFRRIYKQLLEVT